MKPQDKPINIILAGEGGQGVQTIAKALVNSALLAGYKVSYIPSFGVEQRGTPSVAYITLSDKGIRYPRFQFADIALVMGERAAAKISDMLTPNTKIIFDSSNIELKAFKKGFPHFLGIPATKYAVTKFKPKSYNVLMYGALSQVLRLDADKSWRSIHEILKDKFKTKEITELNHDAFQFGFDIVFETKDFTKPSFETKKTDNIFKSSDKIATISPARCKGCGICIEKCPVKVLSFGEDLGVFSTPVPDIDIENCIACDMCRRFCPDGAIKVDKIK